MTQENKTENKPENKRNKSARDIEAEIGETRNALSDDIKALSDKVSPAHLKQEAKNALNDVKDSAVDKAIEVKDAAVEKAVEIKNAASELTATAVDKANELKDVAVDKANQAAEAMSETFDEVSYETRRVGRAAWKFTLDNAVPLSLIGLGAGWLIANRRRSPRSDDYNYDYNYEAASDYPADNALFYSESRTSPRPSALVARDGRGQRRAATRGSSRNYEDLSTRASNGLNQVGERVANQAQEVYRKAGEKLEGTEQALRDGANRGSELVRETYARALDASRDFAQENPLALALGTLVAGIGVGLLLPSTTRENRLLGPSRAKMRGMFDEARDAAQQVGAIARQTARDTVSAVENQVQHH